MAAVTIITPYRNASAFVESFIFMLRRQSFEDWCCFLIDDASTDDGPLIAARLTHADSRFVLFSFSGVKDGLGPAAARNDALARVCTPLVAFCDIDDLWHPQKLDHQLAFHTNQSLDLSVTGYWRFLDSPGLPVVANRCPPACIHYRQLFGGNPIPMLSVIVRSDYVRSGMPELHHEDFALWLNLFRNFPELRYGCLPEGLGFYRLHSSSLTHQRWKMPFWAFAVFRGHGLKSLSLASAMVAWLLHQLFQVLISFFQNSRSRNLFVSLLMELPPVQM